MGHYLFQANYTLEGIRGIRKEGGTARRAVVEKLVSSVGGTIVAGYWAFGATDYYLIAELPDDATAAALAMTVAASGALSIQTTVLLSAEDLDRARDLTPEYRPPGG